MKQKSILLLTAVFIFSLGVNAQFYYTREYNYYHKIDKHDNLSFSPTTKERNTVYGKRISNNVKSCRKVKTNHKQDTISITNIKYNKKGRIIASEKKGQRSRIFELTATYSNDTLLSNYEIKTNKKNETVSFKYNEENRLIHLLHIKNGEKRFEINKVYQGKHLLESTSINYRKRKPKTYKTINTINKSGKIIKTAFYKNDKLERTWEYDCSDKGVEVKPKKSEEGVPTSSSCSWKAESNDGSYIFYYRTLNGKNIHLYESHYNKDSVLLKTNTFDEKDRLKFEAKYKKNHKVDLWYKPNGKIKRYYTEVSDPNLGVVATTSIFYGLGKSHNSVEKSHNDSGLLVELVGYSNGKRSKTNFTYSYFN